MEYGSTTYYVLLFGLMAVVVISILLLFVLDAVKSRRVLEDEKESELPPVETEFTTGMALPYSTRFTKDEYLRLRNGLHAGQMEEKWDVVFHEPFLFFHRSWTGQAVYRVKLVLEGESAVATEALWADAIAKGQEKEIPWQTAILDFLISNLLLGQEKPFPVPRDSDGAQGLLQHHISGTGYSEVPSPALKGPDGNSRG